MAVCAALLYGISFAAKLPRSSGGDILRGLCNCSHRSSRNLIVSLHVYLASVGIVGDLDGLGDVRLVRAPVEKGVTDDGRGYCCCDCHDAER